jgi:hypothetical protein
MNTEETSHGLNRSIAQLRDKLGFGTEKNSRDISKEVQKHGLTDRFTDDMTQWRVQHFIHDPVSGIAQREGMFRNIYPV